VGSSSGIIEKIVDRSYPSFLEYRMVSGLRELRATGYADQAGKVKKELAAVHR
jgi:hypothetical protein